MSTSHTDSDRAVSTPKPFKLSKSLKSVNSRSSSQIKHSKRSTLTSSGFDADNLDAEADDVAEHEELAAFEHGAAVPTRPKEVAAPLVIQVSKVNNWRERVRARGTNAPPAPAQAATDPAKDTLDGGLNGHFGLVYAKPTESQTDAPKSDTTARPPTPAPDARDIHTNPLTQDEAALQALIADSTDGAARRSDLVIRASHTTTTTTNAGPYDETRSFRADVASRPDPASLASYEAVPVEEFGAALLRGMGWRDGEPVGKGKYGAGGAGAKPRVPERRPGFLGIGAKEIPGKGGEVEIGAWGKAAMRKRGVGEGLYTPVVMKNRRTGETITEEEFRGLVKAQEQGRGREKGRDTGRSSAETGSWERRGYSDDDEPYSSRSRSGHKHRHSDRDGDDRRHRESEKSRHHTTSDRHRKSVASRDRDYEESRSSRHKSRLREDDRYRHSDDDRRSDSGRHRHDSRHYDDDDDKHRKRARRH